MSILAISMDFSGQVGVRPRQVFITSNDTYAQVTTAGYLNPSTKEGYVYYPNDIVWVAYGTNSATIKVFQPSINGSSGIITLTPVTSAGEVVLPTIANHIATYTDTQGTLSEDPTTALTTGSIQASVNVTALGSLIAGANGDAGTVISYPATASKGSLILQATENDGDTNTTITNLAMGQASTLSIPDPAAASALFLLSNGGYIVKTGTATSNGGSATVTFTATGVVDVISSNPLWIAMDTSTNLVSLQRLNTAPNQIIAVFSDDPGANTHIVWTQLQALA